MSQSVSGPTTAGGARLPAELARLVGQLRSSDPQVRDEHAWSALAQRLSSGRDDAHLVALGDAARALLLDPQVQARTFGALLLGEVVERANAGAPGVRPLDVVTWFAAFAEWYPAERDLRGHDPQLGWLHAVAHGADTLAALGASPLLGPPELLLLLDLARERVQTPTPFHLVQNEDDRLAYAVLTVLLRDAVDDDALAGWVDRLAASWRDSAGGPVPAELDNTVRFARTLHLQLTLGVRDEPGAQTRYPRSRDLLLESLGSALADVQWFYGRPGVRERV
jgi:hypothetical protein